MRLLPALLALLPLAVGGLAAFAWAEAGVGRYAGLEAQGKALAGVLRSNVLDASQNVQRAERALEQRLRATARWASDELEFRRAPRREVLEGVAKEARVSWLAYVDAEGQATVARWPAPVSTPGGVDPALRQDVEEEQARADAKRLALAPGEARVEGHVPENAFGAEVERYGLAFGRPEGGVLLLRAKEELADVRRRYGLGPALARVAAVEGVVRASLLDADGRVILDSAGATEGTARPLPAGSAADAVTDEGGALRVTTSFTPPDADAPLAVDVVLSTATADAAVDRSRRAILVGTALVAAVSLAAAAGLGALARRHERARARLEARREEDRRLADMGALASLFTHEMSNPLNAMRLGLRLLDADPAAAPPPAGVVATLRGQADRMAETLEQFLTLARGRRTGLLAVDAGVLDRVRARVAADAERRRVRVLSTAEAPAPIASGDPAVVEQALVALVRNAVEASPAGGEVSIVWRRGEDGLVVVDVVDRGPGFPSGDREEMLRLGRTGRPGGHGLGLALSRRFLEAEGGRLELLDAEGGGALARVVLAAADAPRPGTPDTPDTPDMKEGR